MNIRWTESEDILAGHRYLIGQARACDGRDYEIRQTFSLWDDLDRHFIERQKRLMAAQLEVAIDEYEEMTLALR
jgi:hypothetical protein